MAGRHIAAIGILLVKQAPHSKTYELAMAPSERVNLCSEMFPEYLKKQ
jgi:hypothetical protein